ncbi:MAG: hypothetical protein H0X39_00870 [Actinobacteria bacterium]|nr:hypothetical protein [Actinomycetota bacterium]
MTTNAQTPTLADVITGAIEVNRSNLRVALPGRVETYDAATQSCSVQLLVHDGVNDETGTRQPEKLPVITSVPVVFPGGGGGRLTFPIKAGDTVLCVFASSSIDRWLALGGEVDPVDDRRHHISDAIAIPGLHDFAHATAASSSAVVLEGSDVRLGSQTAFQSALMGDSMVTALTTLFAALSAYALAIKAIADPTNAATPALTGAITAFTTAATAAKSLIVKVG